MELMRETSGNPKPKVLVIDDHPMVREGITSMLSGEFEALAQAGTGEDALKVLTEFRPDVILLDLQLPDVDGLTVLQRIKEVSPTTSVLVVTMHGNPTYLQQAIKLGAAGYVLKGVSRRELVASVRAVYEGESAIEPLLLRRLLEEVTGESGPHAAQAEIPEPLTPLEREVLAYLTRGLTNREIAEKMRWSVGTAKKYVQRILEKLHVSDRTQAAVEAVRRGLVR
jgi:DNA-binding NarL/FixJ family response regulator